jgi:hypothetical protein
MSKGRLSFIQPPFKLSKKLEGKTKKNFEIVIARYDEKMPWCYNYKDFIFSFHRNKLVLTLVAVNSGY